MADTEIIADPPRNATGFDADTSSARNASVAPGNNGNSSSPAHRPFTTDGACHGKARAEKRRIERDGGITPELIAFINRKYGLTEAHARQMQLREIPAEESLSLVDVARKGIFITYFDRDGNPKPGYFRIRFYDGPPGFQADKKPLRYMGPKGITLGTYLAPCMDWKSFEATQQRGYFVESEFAAALMCTMGLPTIELGGCWMFKSKAAEQYSLLDDIKAINLRDREMVIVFDSDTSTKPLIMGALHEFARALANESARPSTVILPTLPGQAKSGPDEYLMARGLEDFKNLPIEKFAEIETLWGLNDDFAVIRQPPSILVLEDETLINRDTFSNLLVADRTIMQINAKGDLKKVSAGQAWIKWPRRRVHSKLIYEPGQPQVPSNGSYNTWKLGCKPRSGDVTPWHNLMKHMFNNKPPFMCQWLEKWIAYPLQCPGTKLHTAVVVYGACQGSGKSITGDMIRGVYGDNAVEIDKNSLAGAFNSYIAKRQFITSSDISERKDLRLDAEKLKVMITRPEVEVNPKYAPKYFLRDCVNWYFSSNHFAAVYADDTDRRYFFVHIEDKLPTELSDPLRAWRNKPDGQFDNYEGFGPLLHYFLNLDLGDFDPRAAAPLTPDRDEVIDAGRSDLDSWCADLRADPMNFLRGYTEGFIERDLWHIDELVAICRIHLGNGVSRKALVGALRKAGFTKLDPRVRTARGRLQLWVLTNLERWRSASESEMAKYFNSFQPAPPKF